MMGVRHYKETDVRWSKPHSSQLSAERSFASEFARSAGGSYSNVLLSPFRDVDELSLTMVDEAGSCYAS